MEMTAQTTSYADQKGGDNTQRQQERVEEPYELNPALNPNYFRTGVENGKAIADKDQDGRMVKNRGDRGSIDRNSAYRDERMGGSSLVNDADLLDIQQNSAWINSNRRSSDIIKWSDKIARINKQTQRNLERMETIEMQKSASSMPDEHFEQKMNLLDQNKSVQSLQRFIRENTGVGSASETDGTMKKEQDINVATRPDTSPRPRPEPGSSGPLNQIQSIQLNNFVAAKKKEKKPYLKLNFEPLNITRRGRQGSNQANQNEIMVEDAYPNTERHGHQQNTLLKALDFYGSYTPISQQKAEHDRAADEAEYLEWRRSKQMNGGSGGRGRIGGSWDSNNLRSRSAGHNDDPQYQSAPMPGLHQSQTFDATPRAQPVLGNVILHPQQALSDPFSTQQLRYQPDPRDLRDNKDLRNMASLELRALVDVAKGQIRQFYEMYDKKMKQQMTHPLFGDIDNEVGGASKTQVLTEQLELLEDEVARRIRDIVWAQSLLKKDQIVTKKRLSETVSDKQLEITLSSFRAHVQDQLTNQSRDLLEMRATLNNQKFEIATSVLNQVKKMNSSRHFLNNVLMQEYETDPNQLIENAHMNQERLGGVSSRNQGMVTSTPGHITRNSFQQAKTEIYDFLNQKIGELQQTYSSKIEMLSNFMIQAQDEIRDLKSVKNDSNLRLEDIKTLIDQRDKVMRDSIQENSRQIVHVSGTLKDQSSFVLQLKSHLQDMQNHFQNDQMTNHQATQQIETRLKSLETLQTDTMTKVKAFLQEKLQNFQPQQPISEVVKQISMLATSLQTFERENIAKIDKNQKQIELLQQQASKMTQDLGVLRKNVEQGVARQDEAEQSFLQSFQDIKSIVLTKLSVFDKQIENKEEYERIRQTLESNEIVQKTLKDQINALTQRIQSLDRIDSDRLDKHTKDTDMKLIQLNDNLSVLQNQKDKEMLGKINGLQKNIEHRISSLENEVATLYNGTVATQNAMGNNSGALSVFDQSSQRNLQKLPIGVDPKNNQENQLPKFLQIQEKQIVRAGALQSNSQVKNTDGRGIDTRSAIREDGDDLTSSYEDHGDKQDLTHKSDDKGKTNSSTNLVQEKILRDQISQQQIPGQKSRNSVLNSSPGDKNPQPQVPANLRDDMIQAEDQNLDEQEVDVKLGNDLSIIKRFSETNQTVGAHDLQSVSYSDRQRRLTDPRDKKKESVDSVDNTNNDIIEENKISGQQTQIKKLEQISSSSFSNTMKNKRSNALLFHGQNEPEVPQASNAMFYHPEQVQSAPYNKAFQMTGPPSRGAAEQNKYTLYNSPADLSSNRSMLRGGFVLSEVEEDEGASGSVANTRKDLGDRVEAFELTRPRPGSRPESAATPAAINQEHPILKDSKENVNEKQAEVVLTDDPLISNNPSQSSNTAKSQNKHPNNFTPQIIEEVEPSFNISKMSDDHDREVQQQQSTSHNKPQQDKANQDDDLRQDTINESSDHLNEADNYDDEDDEEVTNPFMTNKEDKKAKLSQPLKNVAIDTTEKKSQTQQQSQLSSLQDDEHDRIVVQNQQLHNTQNKVTVPPLQIPCEVTGETQNILVLDDQRNESKPSLPSNPSGPSQRSQVSGPSTNRDQNQQILDQQQLLNTSRSQQQHSQPSPKIVLFQARHQAQPRERPPPAVAAPTQINDFVQLNSSGESVHSLPHSGPPMDPPGGNEQSLSAPSPGPNSIQAIDKPAAKNEEKKTEQEQQSKQPQDQGLLNKQVDEITFEILADTVAKEIATMFQSTINRRK